MNKEEQILKLIETAHKNVKNNNYLGAVEILEIVIDVMHLTGKTGKPI